MGKYRKAVAPLVIGALAALGLAFSTDFTSLQEPLTTLIVSVLTAMGVFQVPNDSM